MDVLEWIEKAESFKVDDFLSDFAIDIIQDEKSIDVQRQQWEEDGTDYKGQVIGFYKKSTEELTGGTKREGSPWTLRNTGDFWGNTYLQAIIKGKDLEFQYNSTGVNKSALFATIKKHGEISNPDDIFGLTNYHQEPFIEIIEPKFVQLLKKYYNV